MLKLLFLLNAKDGSIISKFPPEANNWPTGKPFKFKSDIDLFNV